MKISGIYKIISIKYPNKFYIGGSVDVGRRWKEHLSKLIDNKHNKLLQNHFNEYGINDLSFSILLICDKNILLEKEQYFMALYNPYFNVCKIAGSLLGYKHSEEAKKIMSEKKLGHKLWVGRKHKKETKEKISKIRKLYWLNKKVV